MQPKFPDNIELQLGVMSEALKKQLLNQRETIIANAILNHIGFNKSLTDGMIKKVVIIAKAHYKNVPVYSKIKTVDSEPIIRELGHYEPITPQGMNCILRPYQKDGVGFLVHANGEAILADEMGLGKTVQVLAYVDFIKPFPVLLVVPAGLKINWLNEIEDKLNYKLNVHIINGMKPYEIPYESDVVIINYSLLKKWEKTLNNFHFKLVVADEAHAIKNRDTTWSIIFKRIAWGCKHKILVTGTPIENSPIDIYNFIDILHRGRFNFWYFAKRYCKAFEDERYGWNFKGSDNEEELGKILRSEFMIRRLKKDVEKDLPPKQIVNLKISIDNRKEYDEISNDFLVWFKENSGRTLNKRQMKAEAMMRLSILRQIVAEGKMSFVFNWVDNFLLEKNKLVVFCVHKEIIRLFKEHYGDKVRIIQGGMTTETKQGVIDIFQKGNLEIILGNSSMESGHTLTASDTVLNIELPWNPQKLNQRIDRCHRIGQTRHVWAYNLIAINTCDEYMLATNERKQQISDNILDGGKEKVTARQLSLEGLIKSMEKMK